MLLRDIFGLTLSALTVWGFLMAFFINVFMHYTTQQKVLTTIVVSFYAFVFYFIADDIASLTPIPNMYLTWAFLDLVTISLIVITLKLTKLKSNLSSLYVIFGLSLSSFLFLLMHFDVDVMQNTTPWILWDVFAYGGTLIDFTMITVLILNKDVLQLNRLFQFLVRKKEKNSPIC